MHLIIQVILFFILAISILTGKQDKRIKLHLFILSLCIISWLYIDSILSVLPSQYINNTSKIMFVFVSFIPAAALSLIYQLYYDMKISFPAFFYIPSFIFSVLILATDWLLESAIPTGYQVSYFYGDMYWIFRVWLYASFFAITVMIGNNLDNRKTITKTHSRTILYSIIITLFIVFLGYIGIPLVVGSYVFQSFSKIVVVLLLFFFYFTLSKKHPPDPIVLVKKIAVNSMIYLSVFSIILFNLYFLKDYLSDNFNSGVELTFFVTAAILILGYNSLKKMLVYMADRIFYMKGYDYYDALEVISERIREYNDLEELGNYVVMVLRETMKLDKVNLYMYDKDLEEYVCRYYTGRRRRKEPGLSREDKQITYIKEKNGILVIDDEKRKQRGQAESGIVAFMEDLRTEVIVPIGKEGDFLGCLMLGRKLSGESFTNEDESILGTLSNHLATVIENTRLFSEVKQKAERLARLNELQNQIIYKQGKQAIYQNLLNELVLCMGAGSGYLLIWNEKEQQLVSELEKNGTSITRGKGYTLETGLMDQVVRGEYLTSEFVSETACGRTGLWSFVDSEGLSEYIGMPLMDHKEFMGMVILENREKKGYVRGLDKTMLRIYANYIGNLIKNFSLYSAAVEARDYSEGVLKAINNIVITVDETGEIVSSNQSGKEELGAQEGVTLFELLDAEEDLVGLVKESLESGTEVVHREVVRQAKKEIKEYTVSSKFIAGEREKGNNLLIVMTDITEIKKLKQELLQKERLVTIANMASVIVHEIRNPLTSVSTLVKLMPSQHNDEEYLELFASIVPKELDRVNALMEDLLELSRSKKLVKNKVNVLELLEERRKVMEWKSRESGVEIRVSGEGCQVMGDDHKLIQVFQNIMQNGVQAMPEGGLLRVEVGVVDEVEGLSGSMVRVRIADTGKGMSKDTRDNLFKPFFTTKENGTGLGLAVTRKIIEDHGGKISVESELGTGSNFNIYLPRK